MGYPEGWTDLEAKPKPFQGWVEEPPDIPRVAVKMPERINRLRGLGNAVVPQVVEILGRMIVDVESSVVLMK